MGGESPEDILLGAEGSLASSPAQGLKAWA